MAIWIKQSGREIELNDRPETVQAAKDLGWKLKSEEKPKRGRPAKDAE